MKRNSTLLYTYGTLLFLLNFLMVSTAALSQFRVRSYGNNSLGELGIDSLLKTSDVLQAVNLNNVRAIASGANQNLALKWDGTVWQWGYWRYGNSPTPVQVSGLNNITSVACNAYSGLALKDDGTVWGWGYNMAGELGDGTTTNRFTPVLVQGLSNAKSVVRGELYSLALKKDGTVWAWGNNASGNLGDGTNVNRLMPVEVSGLRGVKSFSAGSSHTLALKYDGTVWAWGSNTYGQLGDGTTTSRWIPAHVNGLSNVVAVGCGFNHSLAVRSDGTVWAWGSNTYGQLGDGTRIDRWQPAQVSGLSNVVSAVGGNLHSAAIKKDGTVWAWGLNFYGQLGDGTEIDRYTPVRTPGAINARAVSSGALHSLILVKDDDPDFDLDGSHDLIWENPTTGDSVAWFMQGPVFTGSYGYLAQGVPTQPEYRGKRRVTIVASADLNGDGATDLIWQNSQTGDVSYWLMSGTQRIASDYIARNIPLAWKIVGTADLNHDGKSDLIWQNTQTGDVTVWYMNGIQWTGAYDYLAHNIPTQWRIVGSADFNSDGSTDLLWQNNQTGDVTVWYMNGNTWTGGYNYVAHNLPLEWKIVAIMDTNNDTNLDLIWQNMATGDVVTWYMNGAAWTGIYDYIARNVPLEWKIARTH